MKTRASLKKRQGGAVAIMVGFSIVLLVGFLAMVIDLGHLYLAKSELQNGADASVLAGVKELNGTGAGVASAISLAQQNAGKNDYDFDKPILDTTDTPTDNDNIDIWVGTCPEDSCMVPATSTMSDTTAAGRTFLKVHTRNRDLLAWFAPVWNIFHVSTFGVAVAGPILVDITPIGICELPDDETNTNASYIHDPNSDSQGLTLPSPPNPPPPVGYEFGFERGVTYRVSDANPLGAGTMFWIDPETAVAAGPSTCDGSTPTSLPYICAGKMAFTPQIGESVYTNTGISDPQLNALDSRFDLYDPKGKCVPTTAPPDNNIRQYRCTNGSPSDKVCLRNTNPAIGLPREWMEPNPGQQSIRFTTIGGINQPVPWASRTFADYGVLWSGSRPTVATGDSNDASVSTRWTNFYKAGAGAATGYPQPSPYAATSGNFYLPPDVSHPARSGRRIINIVIVRCLAGGGVCRPATVKGIGRFFLQRQTDISGDKEIYGEFAGLLPPGLLKPQYVLFK